LGKKLCGLFDPWGFFVGGTKVIPILGMFLREMLGLDPRPNLRGFREAKQFYGDVTNKIIIR